MKMVKTCAMRDMFSSKIIKAKLRRKAQKKSPECHKVPLSILDELAARFLLCVPLEERDDLMRICFQLELAHWFFIDFYVPKNPHLSEGTIQELGAHLFNHVPYLQNYVNDIGDILQEWQVYKKSIPVNGAILLNKQMNKILLVKGFGSKATWTFPKGKLNENEEYDTCAAREVFEETGFDITALMDKDIYLERVVNNQTVRLYLVPGVDEHFPFKPRSRGEISEIKWWDVTELPSSLGDKATKQRLGVNVNSFYNAIPFIKDTQSWVTSLCVLKASWSVLESSLDLETNEEHLIQKIDEPIKFNNSIESLHFTSSSVNSLQGKLESVSKMKMKEEADESKNSISENFCPESWKSFTFNFHDWDLCLKQII